MCIPRSSPLPWYLPYAEFGQVQLVRADLPDYCLRRSRERRWKGPAYPILSQLVRPFGPRSMLEDAHRGERAAPAIQRVIGQKSWCPFDDGDETFPYPLHHLLDRLVGQQSVSPYRHVHPLCPFPSPTRLEFSEVRPRARRKLAGAEKGRG